MLAGQSMPGGAPQGPQAAQALDAQAAWDQALCAKSMVTGPSSLHCAMQWQLALPTPLRGGGGAGSGSPDAPRPTQKAAAPPRAPMVPSPLAEPWDSQRLAGLAPARLAGQPAARAARAGGPTPLRVLSPTTWVRSPAASPGRVLAGDLPPPPDGRFVDAEFPPINASIVSDVNSDHAEDILRRMTRGVVWRRGTDIATSLFDRVHPNDIKQGIVGDCWALAGIAALAEFPQRIESLFHEAQLAPEGKYHIRIFDPCARRWNWVAVDDYIPYVIKGQELKPLAAQPINNELWVLLLEKALAKWFGGYQKLNGGVALVSLMMMCECQATHAYTQRTVFGSQWDMTQWDVAQASLRDAKDRVSYQEKLLGRVTSDMLFGEVERADKNNFVMVAWSLKDPPQVRGRGESGELICSDGIVKGHAYSLIGAQTCVADGRTWRVVQVRNPWGDNPQAAWTGAFSDKWPGWSQYPELKQQLGIQDWGWLDGMFFMAWEDFLHRFSHMGIAATVCTRGLDKLGRQQLRLARDSATTATTVELLTPRGTPQVSQTGTAVTPVMAVLGVDISGMPTESVASKAKPPLLPLALKFDVGSKAAALAAAALQIQNRFEPEPECSLSPYVETTGALGSARKLPPRPTHPPAAAQRRLDPHSCRVAALAAALRACEGQQSVLEDLAWELLGEAYPGRLQGAFATG